MLRGEADDSLAAVVRRAGVKSVVLGCTDGRCGSCRVVLDGALVASCAIALGGIAEGAAVLTAKSLGQTPAARAATESFAVERPTRCQMCVGALGVTASVLARDLAAGAAREERTDELLRDATCMCTGRGSWRRALASVEPAK